MQIAFDVLQFLKNGQFHSGVTLAKALRVGRSTIWKAVRYLRTLGLSVDAVYGKGYRLAQPIEFLDKNSILSKISERARSQIHQFDVLPTVTSTNDFLWSKLRFGQKPISFCLSESQTQGRGRQSKVWQSPFARNLYLSLHTCMAYSPSFSALSLVIGMSVIKTLGHFCELPEGIGIKWPNDILYQGKKLAGILIETQAIAGASAFHVVIGIGLNFDLTGCHYPDIPLTDLRKTLGKNLSRNDFSAQLIHVLLKDLADFNQFGFDYFYTDWPHYDLLAGRQIQICTGQGNEEGMYAGINKRGELLISVQKTLKAITSGNISIKIC